MAVQESRLLITIDAKNAENTAKEITKELHYITVGGERAVTQTNALSSSLKALAGYMAGVVTIGSAISRMDAYTGMQNRLKLVTKNQQELNKAMDDTFKIAQNSAQAWDSVVQVYQRFADNSKSLGISLSQVAGLTDTVSKAIAVSGASTASAEAALVQFGQALASGVLRGDEFNSISEQTPALLKAIATGLNTNIGDLRKMAAEGKLTGEVLVKALEKSKESVDELFGKTDFTISQSFTQLSNAVTQFVGEAGTANGSAKVLSSTITELAKNLDTISSVAIVGGIAFVTKALLTQVVAIKKTAAASLERRATLLAELQAQAALSTQEVSRAAAIAQLRAMQLADAQATAARMVGMQRLAYVQSTVIPLEVASTRATAAHTATVAADTVVQNANNVARSRSAILMGAIGGPIGAITIGVASLAAGYMYLEGKTAQANKKLEEQGAIANQTKSELLALEGAQKKGAISDLQVAFDAQNKSLYALTFQFEAYIRMIKDSNKDNTEVIRISKAVHDGTMTEIDALKELNKMNVITPEQFKQGNTYINNLVEARDKTLKTSDALKVFGIEVKLSGNEASNAAAKVDQNSRAMEQNADSTGKATDAQKLYQDALAKREFYAVFKKRLIEQHGLNEKLADTYVDIQKEADKTRSKFSGAAAVQAQATIKAEADLANYIDAQKKSVKEAEKLRKKSETDAKRERDKALKQEERDEKAHAKKRISIAYDYLDDLKKISEDYQKDILEIQKANFGADEKKYLDSAKKRLEYQEELYLRQLTVELNDFNWSEQEKLKYSYETNVLIASESGKLNDDLKDLKKKALKDEFDLEYAYLELAKQQRIFQAKQQFMSETEIINERYRLEEMNIQKINDVQERTALLELNRLKKQEEQTKRMQDAQVAWSSRKGLTEGEQIDKKLNEDYSTLSEATNAEVALAATAEAQQAIWQKHNDRMLELDREYYLAKTQLSVAYGEQITGSFADMFGTMVGEQSGAYKVLFASSKAFSIANASLALYDAMAQASKLPFPANLAQYAIATTQGMKIIAGVKSIADVGFMNGGYTGNGGVRDVAGVVHGKEYVMTAEATSRVGVGTLDAINRGGAISQPVTVEPKIIINTPQGMTTSQNVGADGTITIDVIDQWNAQLMGSANSKTRKSMAQNTSAGARRL